MQLGRKLREIWNLRLGFFLSLVLAMLAALWSVQEITVAPPGLKDRNLQISTAATRALVDTPRSTVLDLGVNTNDFRAVTNRTLLITNVMTSAPAREYIARRAGIPAGRLRISAPITPDWPRPLRQAGQSNPSTKDILKFPGEYRISLTSNPTVPMVDVYAEAPDPEAAARLANGTILGAQDYLRALGRQQGIRTDQQIALRLLGEAKGGTINEGADFIVAGLSFLVVFAVCCAAALFMSRVRQGWHLGGGDPGGLTAPPTPRPES